MPAHENVGCRYHRGEQRTDEHDAKDQVANQARNDFRGCVQGMEARGDASEPPKGGEPHQRHLGHPLDKLDEALDVKEAVNSSTY